MLQYNFDESSSNIFEFGTYPRISYIQKITGYVDYLETLHTHQEVAELFYIEKGSGHCTIENHSYRIKKGDLILINSDILHNTLNTTITSKEVYGIILGIKNLHYKGLKKNQFISVKQRPIISVGKSFTEICHFFSLFNALTAFNSRQDTEITCSINHLLHSLLIIIRDITYDNKPSVNNDYNLGLRIKEYLDKHYLDDINLQTIADELHVNLYYLAHTCKKFLGHSPIQYIIRQRINEAQNLLINTDLTITEIAFHCGYNNSNYFQTVFNNIVGMPPGRYRKSWK